MSVTPPSTMILVSFGPPGTPESITTAWLPEVPRSGDAVTFDDGVTYVCGPASWYLAAGSLRSVSVSVTPLAP